MEKRKKKSLIILAIMIAIIIVGAIIAFTKGFQFDLLYQGGKRIEVDLTQNFEEKDIENIAKEVLGNESKVQTVEIYKQSASIFAKDMTEEQRDTIITKINEKYGLALESSASDIIEVPHTRLIDIISPCIFPLIDATIIILIYIGIRYIKKTSVEILLETILVIAMAQAVLFSIMAITRIPIGELTIPMILTVYVLSNVFCTSKIETYIAKNKTEEA